MGGGGSSTHYVHQTVHRQVGPTDAEIQAQIRQQQQQARIAQQLAIQKRQQAEALRLRLIQEEQQRQRIAKQNFAKAQKLEFQRYLSNLGNMDFKSYIPKIAKGEKHYAVIGPISSGKTTFLNSLFNLKEEVGMGETTNIAKPVYKNQISKIIVWDVPGINKDFSMYEPTTLGFFHSCDKIFVLYKDSPKRCEHIIKVLNKIKTGKIYLIRTQCDKWDTSQSKTLQQQLQTDKQILKQWNIQPQQFYQHSSYKYEYDNQKIKRLIQS